MPTVSLGRGRITRLEVRHFTTGVRVLVYEGESIVARVVLSPTERDHLVRLLAAPDPSDATVEELYRAGDFHRRFRLAARGYGDVDDRLQDAACVTWLRVERRTARGKPTTPALMRTIFQQTLVSCRGRFVNGSKPHRDALGAFRDAAHLEDDTAVQGHLMSPDTPVTVKSVLATLTPELQELLLRRFAGETLDEIHRDTGSSVSTLHRYERKAWEHCHAQ